MLGTEFHQGSIIQRHGREGEEDVESPKGCGAGTVGSMAWRITTAAEYATSPHHLYQPQEGYEQWQLQPYPSLNTFGRESL
jgi:hypothetical protein